MKKLLLALALTLIPIEPGTIPERPPDHGLLDEVRISVGLLHTFTPEELGLADHDTVSYWKIRYLIDHGGKP